MGRVHLLNQWSTQGLPFSGDFNSHELSHEVLSCPHLPRPFVFVTRVRDHCVERRVELPQIGNVCPKQIVSRRWIPTLLLVLLMAVSTWSLSSLSIQSSCPRRTRIAMALEATHSSCLHKHHTRWDELVPEEWKEWLHQLDVATHACKRQERSALGSRRSHGT